MIAWTALTSKISIVIRKTSTGLKILESDWKIWKICRKKLVAMCKAWIYMYQNIPTWYILPTCIRCAKISLTQFFYKWLLFTCSADSDIANIKTRRFWFCSARNIFLNFCNFFQTRKIYLIRIWNWKQFKFEHDKKLRDEVCTDVR